MPLVIAGERSGVGKTTIALALLAAMVKQGQRVQSFKVGPDYIDPMFHRRVTGQPCYNLDPVLTSEAYVRRAVSFYSQAAEYSLIEGVMGLFDGATIAGDWGSTAHLARLLDCPVLLVLDCSRLSGSVAAVVHGYRTLDPRLQIVGLVLNRVGSDRHLEFLQAALSPFQLPIVGVVHRQADLTIPDRHLGLVPTEELPEFPDLVARLARIGQTCFDWTHLLPWLKTKSQEKNRPLAVAPLGRSPIPIALAQDAAFNFYYPDNLELLCQLGAELVPWSPQTEPGLPTGVQGVYLGGGFPEVFAEALAANQPARSALGTAIQAGMPTYAECGGLMYLCETLTPFGGKPLPMVGVVPATVVMAPRLTLGYRRAIARRYSPLMPVGTQVCGHEFHRSCLQQTPSGPLFQICGYDRDSSPRQEGWQRHQLHASYLHLHWGDRPELPRRFLQHCADWRQKP